MKPSWQRLTYREIPRVASPLPASAARGVARAASDEQSTAFFDGDPADSDKFVFVMVITPVAPLAVPIAVMLVVPIAIVPIVVLMVIGDRS